MKKIIDVNYQRKAREIVEIHTSYKEGLATRGLGAVITERSWKIGYNPFNGWHFLPVYLYKTIDELTSLKNIPIDVIGIDDFDLKGKDLTQLINDYGENLVISAELSHDPFWWLEPIHPSWRFVRVLIKPWEQPDVNEAIEIFKILGKLWG